ncbi:hypothetical protein BDB00DRAFT_411616 [Zychaea mexicana]|uniref:uncharacterized protein n=1 Tax=Zychaea mexicana TaxID=64656 RepID=UPI0022FDC21D|nr:uncharacterized protein BDB00DRAFT_411616 [Zychaea mexicana]KAI9492870.1 hypothetical protein BDB00DRAFT_411616 [Zychaea mexicana]
MSCCQHNNNIKRNVDKTSSCNILRVHIITYYMFLSFRNGLVIHFRFGRKQARRRRRQQQQQHSKSSLPSLIHTLSFHLSSSPSILSLNGFLFFSPSPSSSFFTLITVCSPSFFYAKRFFFLFTSYTLCAIPSYYITHSIHPRKNIIYAMK